MTLSRRTFLAATAVTALSGTQLASAASPPGDVVGRVTVGYQGWFACTGDGAPINGWWHWSALDEDGTACSSDYYLRLTNDGGRMFKGQAPLTETRPAPPT